MSNTDSFNITFNGSPLWIILGSLILITYTLYIYKFTIPQIHSYLKYFLILIRTVIIISILLLTFEPQLTIKSSENIKPANYLFIDNSSSLAAKDSLARIEKTKNFIKDFRENNSSPVKEFLFGIVPKKFDPDSNMKLSFSEPLTNFSKIFSQIKDNQNIGSITIVSDGIITDGYEPIYDAEKLGVPVFTIGIGDTSISKDLFIKDVLFNQYIFAEIPTEIEAQIVNVGYSNSTVKVSLFEENKLIQVKDVILATTGINKVKFDYTPQVSGDKKMRVIASTLPNEENSSNNSYTFYLNVIRNKIKVTIISGSPSSDLSAIISSISNDKNIELKRIVEISEKKFLDQINYSWIDSADVLFLIDFPREKSSTELVNKTFSVIQNYKPFFILITPTTDFIKLRMVESQLPFSINSISAENILVQPEIRPENFNLVFSGLSSQPNIWAALPPLTKNNSSLLPKPESAVLINSAIKNVRIDSPLLISRSIGRQKSIAFLAGDIWRWQLSSAEKNPLFFQNFINDIIKWLNISDSKKQFVVKTTKKVYYIGESVEFLAELYDQTFRPIADADIFLKISNPSTSFEQKLVKIKDGLFGGSWESNLEDDFSFEASAKFDGVSIKSEVGRFSVVPGLIEKNNTRMNTDFLKKLSLSTKGTYYSIDEYNNLFADLEKMNQAKIKYSVSEYQLWSHNWTVVIIILLFTIEWFIRKRMGML